MIRQTLGLGVVLGLAAGCSHLPERNPADVVQDLNTRYQRIRTVIGTEMYGPGGLEVLTVAHHALLEKRLAGEAPLVSLEDLWTHALQEGAVLFNQPDRRWGQTAAEETHDMIGQTTIGPWQLTVQNIRSTYGPRYGVQSDWSNEQVYAFCRDHPEIQAKMIIDYIELSYETFGRRSPYAIQRYFWLEPYVKGEIGQAEDWTLSPVAIPPEGMTWEDLTPEMMRNTGFYGKQIVLGSRHNHRGLLFWLLVTGDQAAARDLLRTWRDQPRWVVAEAEEPGPETTAVEASEEGQIQGVDYSDSVASVPEGTSPAPRPRARRHGRRATLESLEYDETAENGGFTIRPDDIPFPEEHPDIREAMRELAGEVLAE